MMFLSIAAGAAIGSFLGNLMVFYGIGVMAQRTEKKRLSELQQLQQGYLEMVERERTRMEKYAKMES